VETYGWIEGQSRAWKISRRPRRHHLGETFAGSDPFMILVANEIIT